ncbi:MULTISPECIES: hypothetical protein [Paenibacillus]|nr:MULTISPECIES: hypothetical protein [Paenibacillus]
MMKWMKIGGPISMLLILMLLAAGCGTTNKANVEPIAGTAAPETVPEQTSEPCYAEIEWVDFLMINDIRYSHNYDATKPVPADQLGDKVGEVSFKVSDNACTDHVTKNGDAAFLPVGTVIYALEGYRSDFRVVADNKIYEVEENPKAATIGDLLDIAGKVDKVSLESGMDSSPLGDFTKEASEEFIRELLPLKNVGFDAVYKQTKHDYGVFLRVHLQDGTSFRMVYYPKGNAFTAGAFGTDRLKELIMTQRQQIKAAAGM